MRLSNNFVRYGWQGCNRILSALCFQCVVFGAVMRPTKTAKKKHLVEKLDSQTEDFRELSNPLVPNKCENKTDEKAVIDGKGGKRGVPAETSIFKNIPFLLTSLGNLPAVMAMVIVYMFLPVVRHFAT